MVGNPNVELHFLIIYSGADTLVSQQVFQLKKQVLANHQVKLRVTFRILILPLDSRPGFSIEVCEGINVPRLG